MASKSILNMDKELQQAITQDFKAACECLKGDARFEAFNKAAESLTSEYKRACESSSMVAAIGCTKMAKLLMSFGLNGMRKFPATALHTNLLNTPFVHEIIKARETAIMDMVYANRSRMIKAIESADLKMLEDDGEEFDIDIDWESYNAQPHKNTRSYNIGPNANKVGEHIASGEIIPYNHRDRIPGLNDDLTSDELEFGRQKLINAHKAKIKEDQYNNSGLKGSFMNKNNIAPPVNSNLITDTNKPITPKTVAPITAPGKFSETPEQKAARQAFGGFAGKKKGNESCDKSKAKSKFTKKATESDGAAGVDYASIYSSLETIYINMLSGEQEPDFAMSQSADFIAMMEPMNVGEGDKDPIDIENFLIENAAELYMCIEDMEYEGLVDEGLGENLLSGLESIVNSTELDPQAVDAYNAEHSTDGMSDDDAELSKKLPEGSETGFEGVQSDADFDDDGFSDDSFINAFDTPAADEGGTANTSEDYYSDLF